MPIGDAGLSSKTSDDTVRSPGRVALTLPPRHESLVPVPLDVTQSGAGRIDPRLRPLWRKTHASTLEISAVAYSRSKFHGVVRSYP